MHSKEGNLIEICKALYDQIIDIFTKSFKFNNLEGLEFYLEFQIKFRERVEKWQWAFRKISIIGFDLI